MKTYKKIYKPLYLGSYYENASAHICINPQAKSWLEISFTKLGSKNSFLDSHIDCFVNVPDSFDKEITVERLSTALKWCLDLDALDKRKYLNGSIVSVKVSIKTPLRLPSLSKSTGVETYRTLRLSSGLLIRPLLLKSPSFKPLFDYQIEGVQWLIDKKAAILADDMGLGKTLQAITALRQLFHSGKIRSVLIICPKSLLANWEEELTKWAPELSRIRMHPKPSERNETWTSIFNRVHILLVNYEQLRVPIKKLETLGFGVIIADEAHKMRKLSSKITIGTRNIKHDRFWALTGTPIERDPTDLSTLLSSISPYRFTPSDGKLESSVLRARARKYILRRKKEDVLAQLPNVLEKKETIELSPLQSKVYKSTLHKFKIDLSNNKSLLALINKLRIICDYDDESKKSSKVDRIIEIIEDIIQVNEKVVVFSYLLRPLYILHEKLKRNLKNLTALIIEGDMDLSSRQNVLTKFKRHPDSCVLLASSRVTSEGLTLTEANHVIFFNEWWNPSANAQARDRIIRIGQKRAVRVYKFVCRGTIEESLENILKGKEETYYEIIDRLSELKGTDTMRNEILHNIKSELVSRKF